MQRFINSHSPKRLVIDLAWPWNYHVSARELLIRSDGFMMVTELEASITTMSRDEGHR